MVLIINNVHGALRKDDLCIALTDNGFHRTGTLQGDGRTVGDDQSILTDSCQDFSVLHRVICFHVVKIGACGQILVPFVGVFLQAGIVQSHTIEQHQTALERILLSDAVHQRCILQGLVVGHQQVIQPDMHRVFLREVVVLKPEKLVLTAVLLHLVEGCRDVFQRRLLVAKCLHHRRHEENTIGQTGFHGFLRIHIVEHGLQIVLIIGIADIVLQQRAEIAQDAVFHVVLIGTESALVAEALYHHKTAERRIDRLYLMQIGLDGPSRILLDGELIAGCEAHSTEH